MTTRIPTCFKTLSWLQGYQIVFKHLHDYEDTSVLKCLNDYEDIKVFLNAYMTTKIPKCFKRFNDYEDIKVFLDAFMTARIPKCY
jgi:hypothetical protein